jgi:hypothetical protein
MARFDGSGRLNEIDFQATFGNLLAASINAYGLVGTAIVSRPRRYVAYNWQTATYEVEPA